MVTFPQIVDVYLHFILSYTSYFYLNLPIVSNKINNQKLSFDVFNKLYQKKYNSEIDPNWLGWFVGFTEGDGYMGKDNSGLVFVITQKESKILFDIKNTLKFGNVKTFEGFSRYMVHGKEEILLLFHIFNGNLHILPRINQLLVWADWLNEKYTDNHLKVVTKTVELSFDNSWFSGFIDAEGCFNIYVAKNSNSVTLRFIVDQKNGLLFFNSLKNLVGSGSIYSRKNNNIRYTASNLINLILIINYLNQFPLKSKKYMAFNKWLIVYNKVIKKEHKTNDGFLEIKRLSVLINKDNDND